MYGMVQANVKSLFLNVYLSVVLPFYLESELTPEVDDWDNDCEGSVLVTKYWVNYRVL